MSARGWVRRVTGAVPLMALLLGAAAPVASNAHCRGDGRDQASLQAPAHTHHQNSNPHPAPGDCPHCPPADCALQSACAAAVVGLSEPVALQAAVQTGRAPAQRFSVVVRHASLEPPTPPPQRSVAIA